MTDRELLELAAKAAGIELVWSKFSNIPTLFKGLSSDEVWNPLTDSGQALELAVKLKIDIRPSMSGSSKFRYAVYDGHTYGEVDPDPLAATRRAIVRAAAEIGRSMT